MLALCRERRVFVSVASKSLKSNFPRRGFPRDGKRGKREKGRERKRSGLVSGRRFVRQFGRNDEESTLVPNVPISCVGVSVQFSRIRFMKLRA